uniref:Uncharacterized protein n=1 Tax=Solanum tuberosum TaxID=4113 RepID=M1DSI5_SOLTU
MGWIMSMFEMFKKKEESDVQTICHEGWASSEELAEVDRTRHKLTQAQRTMSTPTRQSAELVWRAKTNPPKVTVLNRLESGVKADVISNSMIYRDGATVWRFVTNVAERVQRITKGA